MKKNKVLLFTFISVAFLSLGCSKPKGNIYLQYFDKFTKEPVAGLLLDVEDDPYNLSHNSKGIVASGYTDSSGIFTFPAHYLPSSKHDVYVINNYNENYESIGYKLNGVTQKNYNVYLTPTGLLNITTNNHFWENKSYDTLVIRYLYGTDTLFKNSKSTALINGEPNTYYLLNYYSILNNKEQQVYSKNTFLQNAFIMKGIPTDTLNF